MFFVPKKVIEISMLIIKVEATLDEMTH